MNLSKATRDAQDTQLLKAMLAARDKQRAASEELLAAVKAALPVGTIVEVHLGRALVQGKVVSHGSCWWGNAEQVIIENLKTGKTRSFSAGYACAGGDLKVIEMVDEQPPI